jgi:cytochrome oxidase assembly protein ShyY1
MPMFLTLVGFTSLISWQLKREQILHFKIEIVQNNIGPPPPPKKQTLETTQGGNSPENFSRGALGLLEL